MSEAWSIWWHPRRTAEELEYLRNEVCSLSASLTEQEQQLTQVRTECQRLNDELCHRDEINTLLRNELESQREELERYREESKTWRQIERDMEAVYARLEDVEEMKRGYERRIAHLRLRLRDNGSGVNDDADAESSELIDMRVSARPKPDSSESSPTTEPEEDSDWLRTLPSEM